MTEPSDFDTLVDVIAIISNNCNVTTESIGEAYNLIENNDTQIVKLPNQLLKDLLLRRLDGSFGILVDTINNFRDLEGKPLGHLDTDQGKVPIPRFWPTNALMTKKYGLPRREGCETLIVDGYVLSSHWNDKVIATIDKLPCYETYGFE